MKKRILNMLIAAILVLSFMPVITSAEDDLFRYEVDFEDFTSAEKTSPGAVLQAISNRLGSDTIPKHIQSLYAVHTSKVIRFPGNAYGGDKMQAAYKNNDTKQGLILDGSENTVCVEDGKLQVRRNWDYTDERYFAFRIYYNQDNKAPLLTGGVRFKMDLCLDTYMTEKTQLIKWIVFGKEYDADLFRISIEGSNLYICPGNDGSWNKKDYLVIDDFTVGETYSFDFILNLDSSTLSINLNGEDKGIRNMNPEIKEFGWIQFANRRPDGASNFNFALDNIVFEKIPAPELISTNVSNGEEGVELFIPELEFSEPLLKSSVKGMSLYAFDEKVSDAVFELSEDKTKAYLKTPLDYSTLYTIKTDFNVKSESTLSVKSSEISFHTAHKPAQLTLTEAITFDKASLLANDTVTASAKFKNNTEKSEDILLIAALYSADSTMEDIEISKVTVPAGEDASVIVSMTLPKDITGKTLKVYAWNSYRKVQITAASASLE